jgi:hypothetical protein
VCNPDSGYCVTCYDDHQCASSSLGPVCVPNVPATSPPTGGGQCGCLQSSDCNDGLACEAGYPVGDCVQPCTYTPDGYDSCFYTPVLYEGAGAGRRCNTETGFCQECLDDIDCSGRQLSSGLLSETLAAPFCSAGSCASCYTPADCPDSAPGCASGRCGQCATAADCPASAPLCVSTGGSAPDACVPACDGGACPVGSPTPVCGPADYCVQCNAASDCPNPRGQRCVNHFCR